MKQTLDRLTPVFPYLGILLILAGGVAFFVTRRWDLLQNLLVAGGALLLLAFAMLQPDAVRELLSGRSVRYGGSTLLSVLFFVGILVVLYYITYQNSDWRYDTTETAEFTPLPETLNLLETLNQPIHVLAFYPTGSGQRLQAEERLDALQAYSDQLTYEFIDPVANPLAAQEYEISPQGTMVFTVRGGEVAAESSGLTDRAIHTALLKILDPSEKKVYFLTGHGEFDIEDFSQFGLSNIISFNEDLGFTVETLDLRITGAVPADAVMVATIGQQAPMEPVEADALRSYLANGGSLLVARDLLNDVTLEERIAADGLSTMLRDEWGIAIRHDLIIDPVNFFAGQQFSPIGTSYGNSPITGNDLQQFGTVFNLARSIETTDVDSVTKVNLVTTSDDAWGETNLEGVQQNFAELNAGEDITGPLTMGVSAENAATQGQVVVFGDTDFLTNSASNIGGNGLLFSNILNWFADDEVLAELTPRETVDRQVVVDQSQLGLLFLISICLGPGIMAAIGISVWYARRNNR